MKTIEINYNPDELDITSKNGMLVITFKSRTTITVQDNNIYWKATNRDVGFLDFTEILNNQFKHRVVKFNKI